MSKNVGFYEKQTLSDTGCMKRATVFMSRREVRLEAGVDDATVKFWFDKGWLPTVPTGKTGQLKTPRAAFERFVREGKWQTPITEGDQ